MSKRSKKVISKKIQPKDIVIHNGKPLFNYPSHSRGTKAVICGKIERETYAWHVVTENGLEYWHESQFNLLRRPKEDK